MLLKISFLFSFFSCCGCQSNTAMMCWMCKGRCECFSNWCIHYQSSKLAVSYLLITTSYGLATVRHCGWQNKMSHEHFWKNHLPLIVIIGWQKKMFHAHLRYILAILVDKLENVLCRFFLLNLNATDRDSIERLKCVGDCTSLCYALTANLPPQPWRNQSSTLMEPLMQNAEIHRTVWVTTKRRIHRSSNFFKSLQ